MFDYLRQVPGHTWLQVVAFLLLITVIPHLVVVFEQRLPSALATAHAVATAAFFIYAELRRQRHERINETRRFASIVDSVEHARQH